MSCRARFETVLNEDLLSRLDTLAEDPNDETIHQLETAARDLRRLEAFGRLLGGGDRYTALLQSCSDSLTRAGHLRVADRVRLAEILLGPRAALALLP